MNQPANVKYCPVCSREYSEETFCVDDGAVLILKPPETDPLLGQVLKGSYKVEEKVGQGGMGAVYRGVQLFLGRNVAIKTILSIHQASPDLVKRFFREAKLLSQFNHPNIVSIIDFGNTETGLVYMVMEYLTGRTLDEIVPVDEGLPLETIVDLMEQICSGVGAAHLNQLVHRDLKPPNIFLANISGADDVVKILDFGIAKARDRQTTKLTQDKMIVGSPGYISPEQITYSSEADARSDIYALGAILYFMIAGHSAYRGESSQAVLAKQLTEPPEPIDFDRLRKPEAEVLVPVILKAMHQEPGKRYQTTAEFMDALRKAHATSEKPAGAGTEQEAFLPKTVSTTDSTASAERPEHMSLGTVENSLSRNMGRRGVFIAALATLLLVSILAVSFQSRGGIARLKFWSKRALVRGVTDTEITLGMSAVFSGPSKELGRRMKLGIETCFRHINDSGGINGRKLNLVALDDGYEPSQALENMKDLLEKRAVFAIIGNVGTPTAELTVPYALEKKTLFFSALTGANLLRKDPPDRYVFNYRASYGEETAAMVKYLIEIRKIRPEGIAVFAQEDGYGDAGFSGVTKTLRKYGREPAQILKVGYQRNTTDVDKAVQEIVRQRERVQAIIMVATYRPAAKFIQKLKDQKLDAIFANVSFVGSQALAEELQQYGPGYATGVIVTQVVPHFESKSTAVLRYQELLKKYFPDERPDFVSLEGYIAADILAEGIRRAGENLTTDTLINNLESIHNLDLGIGTMINFGPSEHQGSHKVWGTILDESARYQTLELD